MTDLHDEALMAMFAAGRTEAFQVLFERYRNRLCRFIRGTYRMDPAQAEDCVQDVFLRVVKGRASFNPAMRFSTWLYTIARNLCLNQIRDRKANLEIQFEEATPLDRGNPGGGPDDILLDAELGVLIRKAVAELPEHLRAVFMLREIDGLPHDQIADILNLNEPNVRTQLHRAKKILKAKISPYLEGNHETTT